MEIITGITGAAAKLEPVEASSVQEPEPETVLAEVPAEPVEKPEPEGPGLEERSFTLVGKALRFVMKTITPGAWLSVVQQMAGQMPESIELDAAEDLAWQDEARHQQVVEELHDQGFVDAGMFVAASMHSKIHLLVNEAYDIRAVVYEYPNSGVVLDLVTLFGDGTGITYVNRDDPGHGQSPLHPNIYMGSVPVFELLDECLRERPKKAAFPVSVATAPRLMELEYEFGAKRLRGEPVNPVEIADAYLEVIEEHGSASESEHVNSTANKRPKAI